MSTRRPIKRRLRWRHRAELGYRPSLSVNLRGPPGVGSGAPTQAGKPHHDIDPSSPTTRGNGGVGVVRAWLRRAARLAAFYLWRPARDLLRTLRRRHPVRVFTFHRVTDACQDRMTVGPALFRRQLEYLLRTHEVLSLHEALLLLRIGQPLRRPVAVVTFDGGYLSVYDEAFPIMTELGIPGACFITTGLVGTNKRFLHDLANAARSSLAVMGWEEVLRLCMMGWTMGGHSMTHARLSQCDVARARIELEHPIASLNMTFGLTKVPWAFPFGGRDDFTADNVKTARELGYVACFSNCGGENTPPADLYDLKRIDMGGSRDAMEWKMMVHGLGDGGIGGIGGMGGMGE